jgi:hypothetical protein
MRGLALAAIVAALLSGAIAAADEKAPPQKKKLAWEKPPGPIAGRWRASCPDSKNMVIEIELQGEKKATGHIVELGAAGKYGYTQNEEIFRLSADDYGDWVGQLHWRGVSGTERWDPIRLVATPELLDATITTDECYRKMQHVAAK